MSDFIIARSKAKDMIIKYRSAPAGGVNPNTKQAQELTQFVHFTFAQFFELLTTNNIVKDSDTVSDIVNKTDFGIKIYFAQHADASDCPDNDSNHIGRNTIVIVNTVNQNDVWYDMPEADSGINIIQEFATDSSGQALDKGAGCPPVCTIFSNSL